MADTRRRILFVTPPGYGHVFPIVRLARACQNAGHEVRVATCGVSLSVAARAGLNAVNVVPAVDLGIVFSRYKQQFREPYGSGLSVFFEIGDLMVDGVVEIARRSKADLIVHTPDASAAPLAAAKLGIPAVFLGLGLMHTPELASATCRGMWNTRERLGVTEVPPPVAWIDVCPPSLRSARGKNWQMRYIPYHGEDEVIGDAPALNGRPKVLITLGTIVPRVEGLSLFRRLATAAGSIGADFILAHGTGNTHALGDLPPNVHTVTWIRLDRILPECAAVVHHGGSGTTLSALDRGLPQVLLPAGSDQWYNAKVLGECEAALVCHDPDHAADLIQQLLDDRRYRAAAEQIGVEMKQMPQPEEVVNSVASLAG